MGFGEQARIWVGGETFRGEAISIDPDMLVSLRLSTGRYGSLYQEESDGERRWATEKPVDKARGSARTLELTDITLRSFETHPVWFQVKGESPPTDTLIVIEATSEQYDGEGQVVVEGGVLDHLAVRFESEDGEQSDSLRHGDVFTHVIVEGRTADEEPLWLDPALDILLELDPVYGEEDGPEAPVAFAYDGGRLISAVTVDQPFCLLAAPSCVQVEALLNPVGRDPLPFTLTATVVDSASVEPGVRTGYVQEDYYLHLTVTPDTLLMGQRALLDLKATSKRPERDTLDIPAETMFSLNMLEALGGGTLLVEGGEQSQASVSVTAANFAEDRVTYVANGFLPVGMEEGRVRMYVQREADFYLQDEETVTLWPSQLLSQNEVWPTVPTRGVWHGSRFDFDQVDSLVDSVKVRAPGGGAGTPVQFKAEWVVGSGGHAHGGNDTRTLTNPPADKMGFFATLDAPTTPLGSETTSFADSSGTAVLSYTAPQFGGRVVIVATATVGQQTIVNRDTLEVRVPGLQLLPTSTDYDQVGGTVRHTGPPNQTPNDNHYGTPEMLAILSDLAVRVDSLDDGSRLVVNDISLPRGGLFDIWGDWIDPHITHRVGMDADIQITTEDNGTREGIVVGPWTGPDGNPIIDGNGDILIQNEGFRDVVENAGGNAHWEGNHYHIRF